MSKNSSRLDVLNVLIDAKIIFCKANVFSVNTFLTGVLVILDILLA